MSVAFLDCVGDTPAPEGATAVDLETVLARKATAPLVAYVPPPGWARETELAAALEPLGPVIIVRAQRWDGLTPDPLAAMATAVVAGFGEHGVTAAVGELLKG
jgi:hypothetical protein